MATGGVFALNGLLLGVVGAALPALRERLHTDALGVSALLLTLAGAAVLAMQVSGRLADRVGARRVTIGSAVVLILGVGALAAPTSLAGAIPAAAVVGFGNGGTDVAMNALGVRVEHARRRPVMSRLHAMFSLGSLVGASAAAGLPALLGWSGHRAAPVVLLVVAGVGALALLGIRPRLGDPPAPEPAGGAGSRSLLAVVVPLCALAFAAGLMEGSALDWSSVHVTDVAGVDSATGALGLVTVSTAMMSVRLAGDRLIAWLGRRRSVRLAAGVTAVGYALLVTVEPLALVLLGWAIVGAGVAVVVPQVFAVAGYLGGGRMLAIVTTFGYSAFLTGPVLIGGIISLADVQLAMLLPLSLSVVVAALAGALRGGQFAGRSQT